MVQPLSLVGEGWAMGPRCIDSISEIGHCSAAGKGENSPFLWRSSAVLVQPSPLLQDKRPLPFTPQAPAESTQTRLGWSAAAALWVPSANRWPLSKAMTFTSMCSCHQHCIMTIQGCTHVTDAAYGCGAFPQGWIQKQEPSRSLALQLESTEMPGERLHQCWTPYIRE